MPIQHSLIPLHLRKAVDRYGRSFGLSKGEVSATYNTLIRQVNEKSRSPFDSLSAAAIGTACCSRSIIILVLAFVANGCQSVAEVFAKSAEAMAMPREVITGTRFQHVVFFKPGFHSTTLHIYLDGDGSPRVAGRPADDPTPRNSLVLNMMRADAAPAVYVGRPCYHGLQKTGECSSRYWLRDRYSEAVVASLAAVIERLRERGDYKNLAVFGHSGGGTLAVLLASRLPQTESVVSIAANLDLAAWATYNGNDDLSGSLNPSALPPLPSSVRQRHFAGSNDQIVPPKLMAKTAEHLGAQLIVVEGYDHVCCWEQKWAEILNDLAK